MWSYLLSITRYYVASVACFKLWTNISAEGAEDRPTYSPHVLVLRITMHVPPIKFAFNISVHCWGIKTFTVTWLPIWPHFYNQQYVALETETVSNGVHMGRTRPVFQEWLSGSLCSSAHKLYRSPAPHKQLWPSAGQVGPHCWTSFYFPRGLGSGMKFMFATRCRSIHPH